MEEEGREMEDMIEELASQEVKWMGVVRTEKEKNTTWYTG